jgi:hypothetical protein
MSGRQRGRTPGGGSSYRAGGAVFAAGPDRPGTLAVYPAPRPGSPEPAGGGPAFRHEPDDGSVQEIPAARPTPRRARRAHGAYGRPGRRGTGNGCAGDHAAGSRSGAIGKYHQHRSPPQPPGSYGRLRGAVRTAPRRRPCRPSAGIYRRIVHHPAGASAGCGPGAHRPAGVLLHPADAGSPASLRPGRGLAAAGWVERPSSQRRRRSPVRDQLLRAGAGAARRLRDRSRRLRSPGTGDNRAGPRGDRDPQGGHGGVFTAPAPADAPAGPRAEGASR